MTAVYLSLVVALFVSMLLTPQLTRRAARLGLMDVPDARKSHSTLIPRVGGIAIALGALLPCLVWLRSTDLVAGYLAGAAFILGFGIWDDRAGLDYRMKLLGQLVGVLLAVAGGIRIQHLPFAGLDALPLWIAMPVTVLFLVAVTNAFNLLDGLDGLAAGCAILSIGTTGLLAWLSGSDPAILIIAASTIGGVLGFLRYNTHPATVFMGDAGSQFLGFTIGVLVIMLMEQPPSAMSAAVPLLLLGLPVLDTAMVMLVRLKQGRSPFAPDRNHIHHRLLSLGFRHHEAVALIYAGQALIVFSAFAVRYQPDWLLLAWYLGLSGAAVLLYLALRQAGWRMHGPRGATVGGTVGRSAGAAVAADGGIGHRLREPGGAALAPVFVRIERAAVGFAALAVALYLVAGAIAVGRLPADIAVASLLVGFATLGVQLVRRRWFIYLVRGAGYVAVLIVTYFSVFEAADGWFAGPWVNGLVVLLAAAVGLAIYLQGHGEFQVTTLDLLIALVAIAALTAPIDPGLQLKLGELFVRSFVVFYAIELLLARRPPRLGLLAGATVISLTIVGLAALGI